MNDKRGSYDEFEDEGSCGCTVSAATMISSVSALASADADGLADDEAMAEALVGLEAAALHFVGCG